MRVKNKQQGFTLIELAIVLVIVGLLLGSFIGSLSQRIETTKRENTIDKMREIKQALFGFVSVYGRLPCPALTTSNGLEAPLGGGVCTEKNGFVPAASLGLEGSYNLDGLLVDRWSNPYRYSVTTKNTNAFTTIDGIKNAGLASLSPDLRICNSEGCSDNIWVDNTPFVILSLGSDGSNFVDAIAPDSDQGENSGEKVLVANGAGENIAYTVANDKTFVKKSYSTVDSSSGKFDDLILWVSPFVLYQQMFEAGKLP